MSRRRRGGGVPALVLAALIGCGGGGGDPDGGAAGGPDAALDLPEAEPLTVDEYCERLPAASCAFEQACGFWADLANCTERDPGVDPCRDGRSALADGRAVFDEELAGRCIAAQEQHTTCAPPPSGLRACDRVFAGQVADGGDCYQSWECGARSWCDGLAVGCPGTCAPRAADGAPASFPDECLRGRFIYDGRCRPLVELGGSCAPIGDGGPLQCRDGYCDGDHCVDFLLSGDPCEVGVGACFYATCVDDACFTRAGLDEACQLLPTGGTTCPFDLVCRTAEGAIDGVCTEPLGPGEPCPGFDQCDRELAPFCYQGEGDAERTCRALLGPGAPCEVSGQCQPELYCDGTCVERVGDGDSCADSPDSCQPFHLCDFTGDGLCHALQPDGGPCDFGDDCLSGFCDDDVCRSPICRDPV